MWPEIKVRGARGEMAGGRLLASRGEELCVSTSRGVSPARVLVGTFTALRWGRGSGGLAPSCGGAGLQKRMLWGASPRSSTGWFWGTFIH